VNSRTASNQSGAETISVNHAPSFEEIRFRAHEIHLERGGLPGNELDYLLQAERELQRAAQPRANGFSIKEDTQ
jgi:hypothetical protein